MRNPENEPVPRYTIEPMTADDIDAATEMRKQSWLDTYLNDDAGVTKAFIERRFEDALNPENRQQRIQRLTEGKSSGNFNAWIARGADGTIVGAATPFITPEGIQRVGSLYVDTAYHGTGLGSELMQRVVDWFDPAKPIQLEVITYNDRAQAFYRKWGFEPVPDTQQFFAEIMPEITMIRPPQNELMKGDA